MNGQIRRARAGWAGVALCGLVVLGGAACSKNETTTTGASSTTAAAGASSTTKASSGDSGDGLPVGDLTKAELIVKVDEICKTAKADINKIPEPTSAADMGDYLDQGLQITKQELKDIEALGAPKDDADAYREAIKKLQVATAMLEEKLPALKKDPSTMASDTELKKASDEANEAAQSYGFKECGKSGSSSSSGSGSKSSTTTG